MLAKLLLLNSSFSIASPPDLQDWTRMAETFDNLTNSVSTMVWMQYIHNKLVSEVCNLLIPAGPNRTSWKVCWPNRFLSFCHKGVLLALVA